MNRTVLNSFTILCLLSAAFLVGSKITVRGSSELPVHNVGTGLDYETIQGAIDATETLDGHTILVDEGTYYEHIILSKSLSLIGENRDTTIVDGNGMGTAVNVTVNEINISNVTIRNSRWAIYVINSTNIDVTDTNIKNNIDGISVRYSSAVKISQCNITNNHSNGVYIYSSSDNNLTKNNITGNGYGITIAYSPNNLLSFNNLTRNDYNFKILGKTLSDYIQHIDFSNTLDGESIYYLIGQHDTLIEPTSHPNIGYLALVNSTNITIREMQLKNKYQAIVLAFTRTCTIKKSDLTNNHWGIELVGSSSVTVSGNNISNNYIGIYSRNSSSAIVSLNNITANIDDGVRLINSTNNHLSGNDLTNNGFGISMGYSSNNNTVSDNDLTGNGLGIWLFGWADNNTLEGNNVTNGGTGIVLSHASSNKIYHNNITANSAYGIVLRDSPNTKICGNIIANDGRGVKLEGAYKTTLKDNDVTNNQIGILFIGSNNNSLTGNNITDNYDGIWLIHSSNNNTLRENNITVNDEGIWLDNSSDNIVLRNDIRNNEIGLRIQNSSKNKICHNKFINNTQQTWSDKTPNYWDNGYPSSGNYWSDYNGTDLCSGPSQNGTGSDGIGEDEYIIDKNNKDNYPLMGMFSSFNTTLGKNVNVISNSTIENFEYFDSNSTIKMHVSNMTADQTFGFCRVCIPHTLMNETYHVTVDDAEPHYVNYTLYDDGENRWIYFSYEHSTLKIIITPEFPSFLLLPLFMIATLLTVIVYRRKHSM